MSATPTQSAAALVRAWRDDPDIHFAQGVCDGITAPLLAALLELVEAQREALRKSKNALVTTWMNVRAEEFQGRHQWRGVADALDAIVQEADAALALTETPDAD